MKILLIDDDTAISSVYAKALQDAGFQTLTSTLAKEGEEKVKQELPDLVLLDQSLPDGTGNEILKALKADDTTKNIPVLLLSNFSQQELVDEAINNGAADYIFKYQVEPEDVVKKTQQILGSKQ